MVCSVDFYQYLVGGVSEEDLKTRSHITNWANVEDGKLQLDLSIRQLTLRRSEGADKL